MRVLWEAADFVRRVRRQMRFGELSRAPLRLLCLELRGDAAKCEWVARPRDPFDAHLTAGLGHQNETLQALHDVVAMRGLLFDAFPDIHTAEFRVYRQPAEGRSELIIAGMVTRADEAPQTVRSVVMRAKLCGLEFSLEGGALETLQSEKDSLEFAI